MSAELPPIPSDYPLVRPLFVVERGTGARFFACNCPSVPHNRTLRYVAANRAKFSLVPPPQPAQPPQGTAP